MSEASAVLVFSSIPISWIVSARTGGEHVPFAQAIVEAITANKTDKIKTVIIQNEQAASFMATGYGMFSKKLDVCFATGGPGAFNLFSGLAVAYSDPVLEELIYTALEGRPDSVHLSHSKSQHNGRKGPYQ